MKIVSKSLEETRKTAQEILAKVSGLRMEGATVLLLEGNLGSGKTTFVQFLAKELGIKNQITSPTFVLIKSYRISNPVLKNLVHIDAYRLDSGQDLLALGWLELAANPGNLIVLEWPERVANLFTGTEPKIIFKFIDEKTREISSF